MGESTDSGGGGNESNNEPRGTVFGVDGRSKTGSTSQDKAIGFTDGQGGKGSNYEALNNATSQQTSAAVAAANAAKAAGGNETAQQAAVGNILDSYNPDFVNRSGNLTDSGQSAIGQAVNEALEDTTAFEQIQRDQQAANLMGVLTDAPPARAPADFDSQLLEFLDPTRPDLSAEEFRAAEIAGLRAPPAMGQDMQLMSLPSPSPARALQTSPYRSTTTQLLGRQMTSDLQLPEERQNILQEIRNRATVGDEVARQVLEDQAARDELGLPGAGRVDMSAPNAFAAPARQALVPVGIASTPQATAANVLQSTPVTDMLVGQQSSVARPGLAGTTPDGRPITTTDFQSVYVDGRGMNVPRPQMSVINTAAADPMTQLSQEQAIFGLGDNAPGARTTAPAPELSPLEQMVQDAVAASEPSTPVTPTGPMGQQAAAGTPAADFYADAYRELNPDIETIPGEGLFGFTNALGKMSPIGLLTGTTSDPASPADQAAFQSGQLLALGGTMDPETGAISGAKAGRGELNMNRFGMVTYSGMPDPNYTGPFSELVNPRADTSDDGAMTTNVAQTQQDPCPDGYTLVDGVCQPVDDVTTPDAPGSGFVINPTTGLPTVFQPTTQATQIGQINPFVLQPYPQPVIGQPVPFAGGAQGIQALSPTGAALGRQV